MFHLPVLLLQEQGLEGAGLGLERAGLGLGTAGLDYKTFCVERSVSLLYKKPK